MSSVRVYSLCGCVLLRRFIYASEDRLDKLCKASCSFVAPKRNTEDETEKTAQKKRSSRSEHYVELKHEGIKRHTSFQSRNVGYERFFDAKRRMYPLAYERKKRDIFFGANRWENDFAKKLEALPQISKQDFSEHAIKKNLYVENPVVRARSQEEILRWLKKNEVTVKGNSQKPVFSFEETGFPDNILKNLLASGYSKPTEIQSVAWPSALSGCDLISIARTGSGKTLAYALPGIVHLQAQTKLSTQSGPKVLILAPTRELVQQISEMTSQYWHNVACAFGGSGREKQARRLRLGVDILAAAPGRLLDFLIDGVVNLHQCSYLVLDEADRMLDMGFEPQIRKIVSVIRSDRQTLMFSATWPKEIRRLANDFLTDPVFLNVGSLELAANHNIKQLVEVVDEEHKTEKLLEFLEKIGHESQSKTLIFVGMKRTADWLTRILRKEGFRALSLHGDKSQAERSFVMNDFKNGECSTLIATDVAARGLDVNDIRFVINYDCPNNIQDYIHRIGRTARHDKTGTAFTLLTMRDAPIAHDLIGVIEEAKQTPSHELLDFARGKNISKKR